QRGCCFSLSWLLSPLFRYFAIVTIPEVSCRTAERLVGSCLRRRRTHYWRCCRPDESCRQRAPRLQRASPHIPRCPDLLRLSTVSGGGRALHSFLGWSVFSFGGRAGEKIRILTLRTCN